MGFLKKLLGKEEEQEAAPEQEFVSKDNDNIEAPAVAANDNPEPAPLPAFIAPAPDDAQPDKGGWKEITLNTQGYNIPSHFKTLLKELEHNIPPRSLHFHVKEGTREMKCLNGGQEFIHMKYEDMSIGWDDSTQQWQAILTQAVVLEAVQILHHDVLKKVAAKHGHKVLAPQAAKKKDGNLDKAAMAVAAAAAYQQTHGGGGSGGNASTSSTASNTAHNNHRLINEAMKHFDEQLNKAQANTAEHKMAQEQYMMATEIEAQDGEIKYDRGRGTQFKVADHEGEVLFKHTIPENITVAEWEQQADEIFKELSKAIEEKAKREKEAEQEKSSFTPEKDEQEPAQDAEFEEPPSPQEQTRNEEELEDEEVEKEEQPAPAPKGKDIER